MSITASGATSVRLQVFANVNLMGASNPTGTITYQLFGPGDVACSGAPIFVSSVAVNGTSVNSDRFTTTAAGTYRWQATYSGDAANSGYGPTSCSDPSASVAVSPVPVGLSTMAAAPAAGTIHATASVGGANPTGTVTFLLTAPGDTFCSTTPIFSSVVTVAGSGTYASGSYRPTQAGSYKWRAIYSGDTNNYREGPTACLDTNAAVTVTTSPSTVPVASISPAGFTFATAPVGSNSAPQAFTVSNTGSANLAVSSVQIQGANAADFVVNATDCDATNAPGTSCSVSVTFAPRAAGSRTASLVVADNASSGTQTVSLSGAGTAISAAATFTNPVDGQTNADPAKPFTWTPVASAQAYYLLVGTTAGANDVASPGMIPANQTSFGITDLPAGKKLYASLWTETNGSWNPMQSISFSITGSSGTSDPGHATLTSPLPGQEHVSAINPFTWTTSSSAQAYYLTVGTTSDSNDVADSGVMPASQSSFHVSSLRAGITLHATMWTQINGTWHYYQDVTFTAG